MARPLRIGIDLTALLPVGTGVDTYLLELLPALAREDRTNDYHLFVNREDTCRLVPHLGDNFRVHAVGRRGRPARLVIQQAVIPLATSRLALDVLHSPSFFTPLHRGRARHVVTVFDMTFFTHPHCHTRLRRSPLFRRGIATSVRRADLVCVPTGFVRDEILRLFPEVGEGGIRVVPLGVATRFSSVGDGNRVLPTSPIDGPYVLYVGTLEPRKDLDTLLRAWHRVVQGHHVAHTLVIAGKPGWGHRRILAAARGPEIRGRVRYLEYVPDSELPALYAGADCFVYPSLAEGFGFPPLEAMACGVATVATDTSALRENLAGAAELVPVRDPVALSDALAGLLGDAERRRRVALAGLERARQFSWERTARLTLACYEELATRNPRQAIRDGLSPAPPR